MADWLIIRLSNDPAPPSFMVADAAGRTVQAPRAGTLADARQGAPGRRVCVLVPGSDVLLTDAEVPARAGTRVHQIVPFALEEQLAEDIDALHFALGRREHDGARMPVAVVSRTLMDGWLGQLRAAGLEPEVLFADSSLVPVNPGQAVALLDTDCIVVRPAGGQPVTMPLAALSEALKLLLPPPQEAGAVAAVAGGGGLVLYATEAQWQQHRAQVESLHEQLQGVSVQLLAEGPLALLARQLPGNSAINLLQGPYQPASPLQSGRKSWQLAAALLLALLVLHGVGSAAQLFVLQRHERTLDRSIEHTFAQAMPGEHSSAGSARRRMQARLQSLQGGNDATGLLAMLSALAQAAAASPGTAVQALSFRDGLLELQVSAPGAEALDHISRQLRAGGWQADLTSGNAAGAAYQGRIQIKP